MYKASVNTKTFEITTNDDELTIDGGQVFWDIAAIGNDHFHIIYNKKSYEAEFVKADRESRTFTLKINGRIYPVQVRDRFDLLLEKMGMSGNAAGKINSIKAPMPGLIIDLKVKDGETVKAGDPLLILEAMKMENIIKSPGEGTVKSVKIRKGDSVEKNQVLIEF